MLLPEAYKLRDLVKHLEDQRILVTQVRGIQGYLRRFSFNRAMRQLETKTLSIEIEFKKLQDQAKYAEKVEPMLYVGYFMVGILSLLLSTSWIILEVAHIMAHFGKRKYATFDFMNLLVLWLLPAEGD